MAQTPKNYAKRVKKIEKYNQGKPLIKQKSTLRQGVANIKKMIKDKRASKSK